MSAAWFAQHDSGRVTVSWPDGRPPETPMSSDLIERWVTEQNRLRSGSAVGRELLKPQSPS